MTSSYANFFEFGKSLNNNIAYTNSPANPLTYAIMPNYNTDFNHGPTAHWIRPFSTVSATYMKELANGMHGAKELWNTYCEAYLLANPSTYWMNMGAINSQAFAIINAASTPKNTVGQNLLRNALELHCIYYPGANFTREQFDPNIANSPYVSIANTLCDNCAAKIIFSPDPDNDRIIEKVLSMPTTCTDVLAYMWAALHPEKVRHVLHPHHITLKEPLTQKQKNSKLHQHLTSPKLQKYYEHWFKIIMKTLGEPCPCHKCTVNCYNRPHRYSPQHSPGS